MKRVETGALVTVVLAIIGFAFWLGGLQSRIAALEGDEPLRRAREQAIAEVRGAAGEVGDATRVLVSASQLWVDSGVEIQPGETLHLSATGLVNLAIHRVVQTADRHAPPPLRWNGPDGAELPANRPLYVRRQQLLPYPQAPYGTLLMYARPVGEADPSKYNPAPPGIQEVGRGVVWEYPATAPKKARLFFCVKDTYLKDEPGLLNAFVGTQEEIDETYGRGHYTVAQLQEQWKRLIKEKYWEVWFDNNVGYFLVGMRLVRR